MDNGKLKIKIIVHCPLSIIHYQLSIKMKYSDYLESLHYESSTITVFELYVKRLYEYLESQDINISECRYSNMLGFMQYLEQNGFKKLNINRHLSSLSIYFTYLKKIKQAKHNPLQSLRIKNIRQRLPHDILSKQELQKIYDSYQNESLTGKRDKMILGLLVYQGLIQCEILTLTPQDINLIKGTVSIRKHNKANARILKLEPFQVLPLQEYIKEIRPEIIKIRGKESKCLFVGKGLSKDVENSLRELMDTMKKRNPELKHQTHIRTSVISHWVKEKNLREAQYLAGHNSINSTERYKKIDLRNLLENLKRYHPLK
jgi:integrase/recombinase XerD